MVVDDIGEMIGRQLVGTLVEHLVVDHVAHDAHIATDEVVDMHGLTRFDLETHHILLSLVDELSGGLLAQGERVAHQHARMGIVLEILDFRTLGLQLLGGVEGIIGLARIQQLLHIFLIYMTPFALAIRPELAAEGHTLVELYAQPFEGFDDIFLGSRHETGRVGILDSENQLSAMLTGKEIIVEGRAYTTDVERPRGARCKPHPDCCIVHKKQIFCKITTYFSQTAPKSLQIHKNGVKSGVYQFFFVFSRIEKK